MIQLLHDSLRLLGAFQLVHHGEPVALGQPRLEELIASLAIHPDVPISRARIAYHFWPDSSEKQARSNVRNLLFKLKKAWPRADEAISMSRTQVTWRQDAAITVDIHRFEEMQARAEENHPPDERARILTAAAECYQGDFLPGCYTDWALTDREQLRSRYASVLERLVDTLLDRRQYEKALDHAKELHDYDPLQESTYRRLMKVYAVQGDRAAALRVYHQCASILRKELGVEPSPATEKLHAQLLRHQLPAGDQRAAPQAIQRPRLIGRHEEWRQLLHGWRDAQQGQARCVVIWGEAGMGKSRLAEEIIDWVQRQGHAWASSRSYAARGALTYAPITEWLRATRVRPAIETVDDLWRVELARLLPSLLAKRPNLPAPGPLTETWQQQRFFQGIVHAVQAVPGPLLLHLDDMQWSDQETLSLLHFLLHSTRTHPLLIVGGIRTEDARGNAPLAALMEALRHADQLTELHLGPLSLAETAELVEQTAGAPVTTDMATALYEASEGHPLYLVETMQGGLNDPASRQAGPAIAMEMLGTESLPIDGLPVIPPKIYALISARLSQLSPVAQQVASVAAVIGRDFTYDVLYAAMSMDELPLIDALDELWTRRIVREQDGDAYDFSHDRIREVAYRQISRARRRLLHRQVAAALEAIHITDMDSVAGELAAHYAQAGDKGNAYRCYRQAAKVARAQHALSHAETMLDAALVHASDDPTVRIELLQEQNIVFRYSLKLMRWRENLEEQQTLLASLPLVLSTSDLRLRLEIELDRSEYFAQTNSGSEATDAARSAITAAHELDDNAALAQAYLKLGFAFWVQSRMAEAGPNFELSARYARTAGNRDIEAVSLELHAATGMFSGVPGEQILGMVTRAFSLAETNGDKLQMASLLNKLGYYRVALGMGDFARAEQEYRRGLALSREIGHLGQEEMILSNLGVLFTNRGDYRQTMQVLSDGLEMGRAAPEYNRFWVTHHYFGKCLMQMGRLDSARSELKEASEQLCQIGNRHFEVMARCDLGLFHHLAGEHGQAQSELTHVLTLIEGHGDLRFEALVSTRLGYALEAGDQLDDAGKMYARGHDLHNQMGQHYYALNALAGSARVASRQGDDATALAHVQTIWETIGGKEMDATVETALTLRTCYTIFLEHDDPRAADVLSTACTQLHRRVSTIDDPEHVARFWQLADHRFFQEAVIE